MACIPFTTLRFPKRMAYACTSPSYRLRLPDGRRVFMEWHNYLGPTFYFDKALSREIEDWWEDSLICDSLSWFQGRGNKA